MLHISEASDFKPVDGCGKWVKILKVPHNLNNKKKQEILQKYTYL